MMEDVITAFIENGDDGAWTWVDTKLSAFADVSGVGIWTSSMCTSFSPLPPGARRDQWVARFQRNPEFTADQYGLIRRRSSGSNADWTRVLELMTRLLKIFHVWVLDADKLVGQVRRVRGEKLVPETVFDDEYAFDVGEV
ncbi:hypothetical protein EHS25_000221 [Saitozyma podzolica]|uniref:Uncharacterized protein n=1 Tax=Saitozyma podzolica TaxID=1890683 RepID=A0A427YVV3_9TREE|nr:hypothetical protein EHS25_000221 [Saitozyma podzolica]